MKVMKTLIIILLLFSAVNVFAQDKKIDDAIEKYLSEIIELRHQIHQYPELGNREFKTAELVAAHLRKNGLDVTEKVAHTGVIGILKGGKPGPVVAVRADMDALPVTEATDLPFKSTVKTQWAGGEAGVMHACGHDIHTSVQLGVVSVLAAIKKDIPGTIMFIFQPAEEGAPPGERGGARLMYSEGIFDDPKPTAVFGLHSSPMPVGTIGYSIGPALAAVDGFQITIKGRQAHGASPQESIDPIVTGAQVVMGIQTLRSRILSPLEPSVITIGVFRSGNRSNIIPAEATMQGTVRTYSPEIRNTIEKRMKDIVEGITKSAGADYEFNYGRGMGATINDPELTNMMLPTLKKVLGEERVIETPPTMGAEDFGVFSSAVPGLIYWLGTAHPDHPTGPIHSPTFRADDGALQYGIRAMSNLVFDYLKMGGIKK